MKASVMPTASHWVPPTIWMTTGRFRTSIAFDDSPVPADKRSISIPDQDRFWLSAGATYAFNKMPLSMRVFRICTVKKSASRKVRMEFSSIKAGCMAELQLRVLIRAGIKKVSIAHLFIIRIDIFNSFSIAFAFGFSSRLPACHLWQ